MLEFKSKINEKIKARVVIFTFMAYHAGIRMGMEACPAAIVYVVFCFPFAVLVAMPFAGDAFKALSSNVINGVAIVAILE